LSNVSLGPVCREEIVEESGVEWPDSLVAKIVIVSLNFWAFVVVRLLNHGLDQSAVFLAESLHSVVSISQGWLLRGHQKSIKLLLLIPLSVFLHNNFLRKMYKQLISKSGQRVVLLTTEVGEDFISFLSDIGKVGEDL